MVQCSTSSYYLYWKCCWIYSLEERPGIVDLEVIVRGVFSLCISFSWIFCYVISNASILFIWLLNSFLWLWNIFLFEKLGTTSFQTTTTLEYLRHNFPWDRLMSCETDNPWSSYSQDLNSPDYFLRGTWKTEFLKTIHGQKRTSSEKKSDGLHKNCSIGLWKILLFELLLCSHTAVQCMEQT